jgi:hypothetical protein
VYKTKFSFLKRFEFSSLSKTASNKSKRIIQPDMGELEHKFEVEIDTTEKKQKLPESVKEELKETGMMDEKGKLKLKGVSPKMLKKMKQEFVKCPVLKEDIQFVQCFICTNFQSRVMGKVLCKGDPLK